MAMTPEEEARYTLSWSLDPKDLKPEARAIYDQMKPEFDRRRAERASRPQQAAAKPPRHPIEDAIRSFLIRRWLEAAVPAAILIIGIIMQAATASKVALCNSVLGQLGQAFSTSANEGCSAANDVHGLGTFFMWLGIAGLVGAAIRIGIVYHHATEARAHFANQAQPTEKLAEPQDTH
jgi:hypothetical protein